MQHTLNKGARHKGALHKVALFSRSPLLGEALMAVYAAQRLRERLPQAEIVWVSGTASLLANRLRGLTAGVIDRVLEDTGITVVDNPPPLGERFDAIVDLQMRRNRARTLAIRQHLPADVFISETHGFRYSTHRPMLWQSALWPLVRPPRVVARFSYLIDLLLGEEPLQHFPYLRLDTKPWRARAAQALPPSARYLGFGPGGSPAGKDWPLAQYIALAHAFAAQGFVPVFFLGPAEKKFQAEITAALPQARFPEQDLPAAQHFLDGVGFAMACAERLDGAVATDSGVGHILAGAHIPLVLLFRHARIQRYAPHTKHLTCLNASRWGALALSSNLARLSLARVRRALDRALAKRQ